MTPIKDKTYLLNFDSPDGESEELSYKGLGTFSGFTTTILEENNENILYWFNNLSVDEGFTEGGWFSESDIVKEHDL